VVGCLFRRFGVNLPPTEMATTGELAEGILEKIPAKNSVPGKKLRAKGRHLRAPDDLCGIVNHAGDNNHSPVAGGITAKRRFCLLAPPGTGPVLTLDTRRTWPIGSDDAWGPMSQ